jgi:hypothetical protein
LLKTSGILFADLEIFRDFVVLFLALALFLTPPLRLDDLFFRKE